MHEGLSVICPSRVPKPFSSLYGLDMREVLLLACLPVCCYEFGFEVRVEFRITRKVVRRVSTSSEAASQIVEAQSLPDGLLEST
jgi:hypothetical protein